MDAIGERMLFLAFKWDIKIQAKSKIDFIAPMKQLTEYSVIILRLNKLQEYQALIEAHRREGSSFSYTRKKSQAKQISSSGVEGLAIFRY